MNKKIYNEDLILNLIVNGDKVTPGNQKLLNELHQMDQATRKLQLANAGLALEMKGLNKDVPAQAARLKTLTKMFNENEKQIRINQQAMDALRQKIGIMGMTVSQLNKYLAVLRSQLMATTDPKIAAGLRKQIDEVNMRITTMTTGAGRMSQAWTKLARDANKYSAAIGWISIVIFGVSNAVGNLINRLTGLDRKLSEVMKTTGLTREEASRLKREFDRMPTPTKTDDLLDMAKIAGKLGIEGFENIKRFTGAVDVLYTALGNDLNLSVEETAEKVGKLVNAFRVTDQLPIDEALLRTGSLLNQLDKSSVASAGTILEYMTRLSSLGTTANYPMEELAGLAAALETVNIPAERGSTALRNIINGLGKYADKFSRILGVTIEDYKKMVENDINGVFLKLIELTSKGDKSIIDIMGSMGDFEISGVRVAEVFGALAKNLDVVRLQQDIATESFKSSASVMSEYNIIINDFKGGIDLQQKRVRLLADEFNLRLRPAAFSMYKLWVDFLYVLRDMAGWLYDHGRLIWGLVSAYIAFKSVKIVGFLSDIILKIAGVTKATELYAKVSKWLFDLWTLGAIRAINLAKAIQLISKAILTGNFARAGQILSIITGLGTFGAVLAGVVAVLGTAGAAYLLFSQRVSAATKAIGNYLSETARQEREMNRLFDTVEKTAAGTDKHKAALKALNELYGKYLPNLLTEASSIDSVRQARIKATAALREEIALKWKATEFAELEQKQLDKMGKLSKQILGDLKGADLGMAMGGLENLRLSIDNGTFKDSDIRDFVEKYKLAEDVILGASSTIGSAGNSAMDNMVGLVRKFVNVAKTLNAQEKEFNAVVNGLTGLKGSSIGDAADKFGFGSGKLFNQAQRIDDYTTPGGGDKTPIMLQLSKSKYTGTGGRMSPTEYENAKNEAELRNTQADTALKNRNLTKEEYDRLSLQQQMTYYNELIGIEKQYESESPKVLADLANKQADIRMQMRQAGMKEAKEEFDLEKYRIEVLAEGRQKDLEEENKRFNDEKKKLNESKQDKLKVQQAIEYATEIHRRKINEINLKWDEEDQKKKDEITKAIISEIEQFYDDMIDEEKERLAEGLITYTEYINEYKRLTAEKNNAVKQVNEASGNSGGAKNAEDLITESARIRKKLGLDKDTDVESQTAVFDTEDYNAQLTQLQSFYDQGIISHEEYELEKTRITRLQAKQRFKVEQEVLGALSDVLGALGSMYSAQKQKELDEAGDNAVKKEQIERKYARKQQAVALGQAVISGALGVMRIIEAKATGNAILDAILKPILIAAQLVTTGIQISTIKSQQFAKGKYPSINSGQVPVIGADDGQRYWADWTGDAKTGIYTKPSLIAEKGPELVVDYPTLRNIKMNAPGLIETIYSMRVPQYAKGAWGKEQGAWSMGQVSSSNPSSTQPQFSDESLSRWEAIADRFENMEFNFNFTEFEKIQNRRAIREKQSKL